MVFHYISDIHIESRVWWLKVSDDYLHSFLWELARKMTESCPKHGSKEPLIILGDTCHELRIGVAFYAMLAVQWMNSCVDFRNEDLRQIMSRFDQGKEMCHFEENSFNFGLEAGTFPIYVVLGDDEYQEFNEKEEAESRWAEALGNVGITLLNGTSMLIHDGLPYEISLEDLNKENSFILNGYVGHRMYDFYRKNPGEKEWMVGKDKYQEQFFGKEWVAQWERIVKESHSMELPLVMVTHINLREWYRGPLPENYLHFHGDDHRNVRNGNVIADGYTDYKDPNPIIHTLQWDFNMKGLPLKEDDKESWIKEITLSEYSQEMKILGLSEPKIAMNNLINGGGRLYHAKSGGIDAFIIEYFGSIYICDGARYILTGMATPEGFLNAMEEVVSKLSSPVHEFYTLMQSAANEIKSIGGTGRVHGCIIDIDFYNHVFVHPKNGNLQWYHADEYLLLEKHDSIESLLSIRAPHLLEGLSNKVLTLTSTPHLDLEVYKDFFVEEKKVNFEETHYPISRAMSKLQKLEDHSLLVVWPKGVVENVLGNTKNEIVVNRPSKYEVDPNASRLNVLVWNGLHLESYMTKLGVKEEDKENFIKETASKGVNDFLKDCLNRMEPWVLILGSDICEWKETLETFTFLLMRKLSRWVPECLEILRKITMEKDLELRLENCLMLLKERKRDSNGKIGRLKSRILQLNEEIDRVKNTENEILLKNVIILTENWGDLEVLNKFCCHHFLEKEFLSSFSLVNYANTLGMDVDSEINIGKLLSRGMNSQGNPIRTSVNIIKRC